MKYEIDKSKEWFSEIIDGTGTVIDIDAIFNIDGKPCFLDFKQVMTKDIEPKDSHPHKYPWSWRSLVRQCNMIKKLGGYLYIIIHSDYFPDQIRVLKVDGYFPDKLRPYKKYSTEKFKTKVKYLEYLNIISDEVMTFKRFSKWINTNNKKNFKVDLLNGEI